MPWGFAAAGAASGIAGAAASSAGGKKGSSEGRASARLSQEQARNARIAGDWGAATAKLTEPLRQGVTGNLQSFLGTGETPWFLRLPDQAPQTASLTFPGVAALQQQQVRSLQNNGVRGGFLQQQMGQANLQGGLQKANALQQDAMTQYALDLDKARLKQSLFGAAGDLGSSGLAQGNAGLATAMSGLGGASYNLTGLSAQRIGQNNALYSGLGNIAGKGVGYAAGRNLPAYGSGSLGAQKAGGGGGAPAGGWV